MKLFEETVRGNEKGGGEKFCVSFAGQTAASRCHPSRQEVQKRNESKKDTVKMHPVIGTAAAIAL